MAIGDRHTHIVYVLDCCMTVSCHYLMAVDYCGMNDTMKYKMRRSCAVKKWKTGTDSRMVTREWKSIFSLLHAVHM